MNWRIRGNVLARLPLLLWLTVVWVGLWGSVTPANLLGGVVVSALLILALPLTDVPKAGLMRPRAMLRFIGFFLIDLVRSSVQVAALVLRPRLRLRPAVLAIGVRGASDQLLTLLANAISLTPGTLTLEVDRPRSTLYVHVIDVGDGPDAIERVRAEVVDTERLAILAVGSAASRRELAEGSR